MSVDANHDAADAGHVSVRSLLRTAAAREDGEASPVVPPSPEVTTPKAELSIDAALKALAAKAPQQEAQPAAAVAPTQPASPKAAGQPNGRKPSRRASLSDSLHKLVNAEAKLDDVNMQSHTPAELKEKLDECFNMLLELEKQDPEATSKLGLLLRRIENAGYQFDGEQIFNMQSLIATNVHGAGIEPGNAMLRNRYHTRRCDLCPASPCACRLRRASRRR